MDIQVEMRRDVAYIRLDTHHPLRKAAVWKTLADRCLVLDIEDGELVGLVLPRERIREWGIRLP